MKNHTFLEIVGKRDGDRTVWKCDNCGAEFSYSDDSRFEYKFRSVWRELGIDVNCDVELVKQTITS